MCTIGILAAPITVKLSRTYFFETPGRNTIFLWTGLVFAGKYRSIQQQYGAANFESRIKVY